MTNKDEDVQCVIGSDNGEDGHQLHNGKYIAFFQNKTTNEQKTVQLENLEHVNRFRDGLCLQGWRMLKPPKIDITKKQTRKLRRENNRMEKKLQKTEEKRKKATELRKKKLVRDLKEKKKFIQNIFSQDISS